MLLGGTVWRFGAATFGLGEACPLRKGGLGLLHGWW
jgi:hypothetical protein